MTNPEQIIQTAWVDRAREDMADRIAQGLNPHQLRWPVWLPEVAVQALLAAGWRPPAACGCGPTESEKRFAELATRILDGPLGVDGLIAEFYEAGGETGI